MYHYKLIVNFNGKKRAEQYFNDYKEVVNYCDNVLRKLVYVVSYDLDNYYPKQYDYNTMAVNFVTSSFKKKGE